MREQVSRKKKPPQIKKKCLIGKCIRDFCQKRKKNTKWEREAEEKSLREVIRGDGATRIRKGGKKTIFERVHTSPGKGRLEKRNLLLLIEGESSAATEKSGKQSTSSGCHCHDAKRCRS